MTDAAVKFAETFPARGPVVIALAGTMLDPVLVFSRMHRIPGIPLIPVDWIGAARPAGLQSAAAALAEALVAVRQEPVVLIGHSSGGALALLLASTRPDLVSALLLINTGANTRGHGDTDAPKRLAMGLTEGEVDKFLDRCFARPLDETLRQGLLDYARACSLECLVAAMTSQRGMDLEPALPSIGCPVGIVHGAQDTVRTRVHIDALLHGIPGSTVVTAKCGHTPLLEAPAVVDAALTELLRRVGALSPTAHA